MAVLGELRRTWRRILTGCGFGALAMGSMGLVSASRVETQMTDAGIDVSPIVVIGCVVAAALLGAAIGGLLAVNRVVTTRVRRGDPTPLNARVLLGSGRWSILLWLPLAAAVVIAAIELT